MFEFKNNIYYSEYSYSNNKELSIYTQLKENKLTQSNYQSNNQNYISIDTIQFKLTISLT